MNRPRLWGVLALGLLLLVLGLIAWAWQRGGLALLQLGVGIC
ncbi:MAG: hypothetical protein ABWY06_08460 [Pseudomonas sp.]